MKWPFSRSRKTTYDTIGATSDIALYTRFKKQSNVDYGDKGLANVRRIHPNFIDNLRNLRICRKCFQLYGQIRLQDGHLVEQTCSCQWPTDEPKWSVTIQSTTYYHDFNREYEVCYCCGLEVIPSGSKWYLFYCRDCKERIRSFNNMVGVCIIPLGRHSLMNDIALRGRSVKNRAAINQFVKAVKNLNRSIDRVDIHRKKVLEKQVKLLQLTEDAPVIDLVMKTSELELDELKEKAFLELVAMICKKPVDEIKFLLDNLHLLRRRK